MKVVIRIIVALLIIAGVLYIGKSSWSDFKNSSEMKDPGEVYQPVIDTLPDIDTPDLNNPDDQITDPGKPDLSSSSDTTDFTTDNGIGVLDYQPESESLDKTNTDFTTETDSNDNTDEIESTDVADSSESEDNVSEEVSSEEKTTESTEITKKDTKKSNVAFNTIVKIGDKSIDFSKNTSLNILDWLMINYHAGVSVYIKHEEIPTTESNKTENKPNNTTTNVAISNENIQQLSSQDDLDNLINSINTVSELPDYKDYDRVSYEKPIKSYIIDGTKYNRNDYAWKTSKWFNKDTFTYMCPYTGTVISDLDDGKEDQDFTLVDYDHIVPLKSTYLRGAKDWSDEQRNAYAYDQSVGIDVLNSANRSKSDKGPSEWLPDINIEDYCYSWLVICSKYNLSMTEAEIQVCKDNIEIALENGETVEFLGGYYENNN